MNEPSLHDHRREAEEAEDLDREQADLEAADHFNWWVNHHLASMSDEKAQDRIWFAMEDATSGIYDANQSKEFDIALFRVFATHGEDLAANRRLIDLLDPYMRSAVRELGD